MAIYGDPPIQYPPDYYDLLDKVSRLEQENAELKKKLKDLGVKETYNNPYASDWHYIDRYR